MFSLHRRKKKKAVLILEKNPIVTPYFRDMQTTLLTNAKKGQIWDMFSLSNYLMIL